MRINHNTFPTALAVLIAVLFVSAWLGACDSTDNEALADAPSDCVEDKPSTGKVELLASVTVEFRRVPVTIFEGDIEKNNIVYEDTLTQISTLYDGFVDKRYSAIALYVTGPDTIGVVASERISATSKEFSDKDCWTVTKAVLDVRLKARP